MKIELEEKHQVTLWQILTNVAETNKKNPAIYKSLSRVASQFSLDRPQVELKPKQLTVVHTFLDMVLNMCEDVIMREDSSEEYAKNAMARKELINEIKSALPAAPEQDVKSDSRES